MNTHQLPFPRPLRRQRASAPVLALLMTPLLVACQRQLAAAPDASGRANPAHDKADLELPRVRVNQLGYLPELPKWAVLVSDSPTPESWQLHDAAGNVLLQGESRVVGLDPASGDRVHQIELSSFGAESNELTLVIAPGAAAGSKIEQRSDRFAVSKSLYAPLARDALRIFYHLRSGVEIAMPYVERPEWGHPAGHHPDLARCARDTGCDYSLDVTGGWYDAGDQGKYVVNGGLSTWLLQNSYERALLLGIKSDALADGASNIPESGNGVPDVLDEARWELEFLISMRVPDAQPLAGLVHHKMHDADWTALGTAPHEDQQPRVLRPPSTAATLNLAAVAAQASRLWTTFDPSFSRHCREVAEATWRAARQHPVRLAPASDDRGGGAYADDEVGDEWYWAAAELFLSTGRDEYRDHLRASAFDKAIAPELVVDGLATSSGLTWQRVAALGQISLALAGEHASATGRLTRDELGRYRSQLRATADALLATLAQQGYRLPMQGKYPWGSNADVLGNMVLLGSAADGDGGERFAPGVVAGMDYLLGRNAMGQSYVTGYGARPLLNPHHRFWAHQTNPRYPKPPPGAVSGGPNSDLQDPYVQAAGLKGCPPQKCFIDHIEAYSVNEVAINWNAALTWSAVWLDAWGRR